MTPVHSRVSRGKKITLSLTDKVKLLDLHKQKPKLGCHPLAKLFKNFKGNMKRKNVLYEWYVKCCQARISTDGAMLQEEALKITTEL